MAFSGNLRGAPRITSFETADTYFNSVKKPRTTRWEEHQRPLLGTSKKHYRIEKGADTYGDYYDAVLFGTSMARYYRPNGSERRVLYTGYRSPTADNFMWHVLGSGRLRMMQDLSGRSIAVPVYGSFKGFSVDLSLIDGRVDTMASKHLRHYKKVITKEGRAEGKQIAEKLRALAELASIRIASGEWNDLDMHRGWGTRFRGFARIGSGDALAYLTGIDRGTGHSSSYTRAEIAATATDIFFKVAQEVYLSRALLQYEAEYETAVRAGHTQIYRSRPSPTELKEPFNYKGFEQALLDYAKKVLRAHDKECWADVEQPQFMSHADYPRSNIYTIHPATL